MMASRFDQCRYLKRNDERCTAEVVDPEGDMLLCARHLAAAHREFEVAVTQRRDDTGTRTG